MTGYRNVEVSIQETEEIIKTFSVDTGKYANENELESEVSERVTRWASNNGYNYDDLCWEWQK
jgi:hypothetical protein